MFFVILFLFLLVASVFGLITWQNMNTLTHLNLYFLKTPEFPVGILLIGAILFGALLLYLVAFLSARRERRELQRLRLRVEELEEKQARMVAPPAISLPSLFAPQPTGPLAAPTAPLRMPGMTGPLPLPPRN